MLIKKYLVKTMEDAQEQINRDLGPQAIILTSRPLKYKGLKAWLFPNHIEVIAAIDTNDPEMDDIQNLSQQLIERFGHLIEKTATHDESLQEIIQKAIYPAPTSPGLINSLIAIGILPRLAKAIEHKVSQQNHLNKKQEYRDCSSQLKKELASLISVSGPICLRKGHTTYAALIGTKGSGKTTACLQMALLYMVELGKKVVIISMEEPNEQTIALANSFNIPLSFAANPTEWMTVLESHKECDLILIDTVDKVHPTESLEHIQDLQIHLVLNASKKDLDLFEEIERFAPLKIASLIISKLDETMAKGCLINLGQLTQLPISYVSYGSHIPNDFFVADPLQIAQSILERDPLQKSPWINEFAQAQTL